ncbi:hypothetical protein [Bacteroides sp.]|uniref:hypothetical protein n=1 Tax=Bacteroides sp. TaxID=29523 RepID=UPI0026085DCE|nr:hypothetical protein [Bacteroides sp.]MDD3038736.1 hypothetical protein [Bacteroides sp.]
MGKNGVLGAGGKFVIEYDEEKKVVTISTPGNNLIEISDDAKSITLKDQHRNEIVMNDNGIKLTSAKDIVLKAQGDISIEAPGKLKVKAMHDVAIEGMNINVKAQECAKVTGTALAELSASGQTTVKGGMVMIN